MTASGQPLHSLWTHRDRDRDRYTDLTETGTTQRKRQNRKEQDELRFLVWRSSSNVVPVEMADGFGRGIFAMPAHSLDQATALGGW